VILREILMIEYFFGQLIAQLAIPRRIEYFLPLFSTLHDLNQVWVQFFIWIDEAFVRNSAFFKVNVVTMSYEWN